MCGVVEGCSRWGIRLLTARSLALCPLQPQPPAPFSHTFYNPLRPQPSTTLCPCPAAPTPSLPSRRHRSRNPHSLWSSLFVFYLRAPMLPSTPAPFGPGTPSGLVTAAEWTQFQAQLDAHNDQRDAMFKSHHKLQQLAGRALFCLHRGDLAQVAELHATFAQIARAAIDAAQGRVEIRSIIDGSMESFVSGAVFVHFLAHGRVPAKAAIPLPVTSTEYLSGVCGFVQELQRYAAARAIQRDVRSVLLCRDVVEAVNARMMQFDFRNSPLRRKYDGIKYTVKRLQDILYELSLTDFEEAKCLSADPRPPADADTMTDAEDFEALRKETEEYDATRHCPDSPTSPLFRAATPLGLLHIHSESRTTTSHAGPQGKSMQHPPQLPSADTLSILRSLWSGGGGSKGGIPPRPFSYFPPRPPHPSTTRWRWHGWRTSSGGGGASRLVGTDFVVVGASGRPGTTSMGALTS